MYGILLPENVAEKWVLGGLAMFEANESGDEGATVVLECADLSALWVGATGRAF